MHKPLSAVDEDYRIIEILEQSCLYTCYRAFCTETCQNLKVFKFSKDMIAADQNHSEMIQCFTTLESLSYDKNTNIRDVYGDKDNLFVVIDEFDKLSLSEEFSVGMNITIFSKFVEDSLTALSHIHKNKCVHGHISSSTIQPVRDTPEALRFIVQDFVYNKLLSTFLKKDLSKEIPYHPVFSTPEFYKNENITAQSDLYLFGQLCYYTILGFHPIEKGAERARTMHLEKNYPSTYEMNQNHSKKISEWISKLTNPDPKQRPRSASEALLEYQFIQFQMLTSS